MELLGADEPGVYWFGVHALGTSAAGRDGVADGRARTFLPYVPPKDRGDPSTPRWSSRCATRSCTRPTGPWPTSDDWVETLGEGGRLSSILDFGLAAGGLPITWLVDPAVPDSADQLVDGNPARELVERPAGETGAGEEPTETPADGESASAAPQEPAPSGEDPAAVALPWLAKLNLAVTGKQVLASGAG